MTWKCIHDVIAAVHLERASHKDPNQRELGCAAISLALQKPESIAAAVAANVPKTLIVLLATDKHTGVRAEAAGALRSVSRSFSWRRQAACYLPYPVYVAYVTAVVLATWNYRAV